VVLIKEPTVPVIASFSPPLLVLLALVMAAILSVALAFVVDYLDPSFRTPDEVQEFLSVPVFASIPENGQEVPVGAVPRNGH
jgi:capsular polysaccharide biosynthesis protein